MKQNLLCQRVKDPFLNKLTQHQKQFFFRTISEGSGEVVKGEGTGK